MRPLVIFFCLERVNFNSFIWVELWKYMPCVYRLYYIPLRPMTNSDPCPAAVSIPIVICFKIFGVLVRLFHAGVDPELLKPPKPSCATSLFKFVSLSEP